ncbi:hypothetical protein NOCARDAX2BIS_230149 [Nocardioides sp. AX2bis]|nr:hypothetical protein NOCARDAX2BIS_230149 [Nocardioides sp. AX2bis]
MGLRPDLEARHRHRGVRRLAGRGPACARPAAPRPRRPGPGAGAVLGRLEQPPRVGGRTAAHHRRRARRAPDPPLVDRAGQPRHLRRRPGRPARRRALARRAARAGVRRDGPLGRRLPGGPDHGDRVGYRPVGSGHGPRHPALARPHRDRRAQPHPPQRRRRPARRQPRRQPAAAVHDAPVRGARDRPRRRHAAGLRHRPPRPRRRRRPGRPR